ncbi:hypothetical protein FD33_GL002249 [Companilactobacillus paralimentarius DSM 13238 = JCM 10415]|uniref:Uncharacterized protein n=1 Tax=Companilactobacillus paralimentarius DSM 13238 = JCM 10415 TaxID=1122151 RepID=A0A0R1PQ72_9LACO|nr:hypothetical protein [Companilactobacillus paralimentarius]KAE9563287.1 hypothetical protein ATN96_11245 [Companilactobacillus paralimentarius]KRL31187.1 hypothetical protein FD33_GL002249 [Companilactobacillus paralimentarius DSM 13238 = JCM 10415]QFR68471.1 hypothetical protein LP238_00405 [Companilactobacillus paralimentarius]
MGLLIVTLGTGYVFGYAASKEHGFMNLFDFDKNTIQSVQKFWKKLDDWFFGPDVPNKIETYTNRTPEAIKKDSLSTK